MLNRTFASNSFPSSTKMSWKAKMRSLAAATFLWAQLLKPSRFSFLRSFSHHMATIMGSHAVSAPRATSILEDNSTRVPARLTPCVPPAPLSSVRCGCLTYSSQLWTPCCYSSSAGFVHAKHASQQKRPHPLWLSLITSQGHYHHISTFPV